jgi:hypothetical protein
MKKLATLLLTLLLVFVDFKTAEHHHEDHQFHHDCELCIIQHQPQHKEDVKLQPRLESFVLFVKKEKTQENTLKLEIPYKYPIRAPPVG